MASKKDSEVQKSEDLIQEVNVGDVVSAEDPVKEVILAVMKIVLCEEERALLNDINEYRNNLSRQLLNRLSELEAQPADLSRFGPSFMAGWQEWKKRGEQREETSFAVFYNAMTVDTETLFFAFVSMTCCFQSPLSIVST